MEKDLFPLVHRKLQEHKAICASHGLFFRVVSAYRSLEDQSALYNQPFDHKDNDGDGKIDEADEKVTNAKAGESYHNWRCAYDIVPIVNGKAKYDDAILAAIGYYGQKIGLEWGGSWASFPDAPHLRNTTVTS